MKRALSVLGLTAIVAAVAVNAAGAATSVTAPTLDPGAYAQGVLNAFSANMVALFTIGGILAGVGGVIALVRKFGRLRTH